MCGTPPPRALSDDERTRLLAAFEGDESIEGRRDRALFTLLLTTGIRVGSALALDIADLDLARCEIALRKTKGDHPETVFMPAATAEILGTFVAGRTSGALFPITTRHVLRRFVGWLGQAGITRRANVHSLRHTLATNLLQKTGDLALVQAVLRHRSIASTLVYARVQPERVRAAIG
jgi:integrase/recombinase XerD